MTLNLRTGGVASGGFVQFKLYTIKRGGVPSFPVTHKRFFKIVLTFVVREHIFMASFRAFPLHYTPTNVTTQNGG